MELMQRICWNAATTKEEVDMFLEMIEKYPDACDDVWMCTKYGYPPMDQHKEYAARLVVEAERIRKAHVKVSMQLSNTMGHGDRTGESIDCSGLVYEGSPVERMVGHDGAKAKYVFCWRGKHFKAYIMEQLRYYLAAKPNCFWIDDDLRPDNHNPVSYGCFCENCIAAFNEQYESAFDRAQLVEVFLHGDRVWRKRYIDFIRQGLYEFTYEMARVVQEVSPDTTICIQNGPRAAYSDFDHRHLLDAVKDATGKIPKMRPGAGAYDDHNPNVILDKMIDINYQSSLLPEYVTAVAPEIENLPCLVFGKTPAGTAFETSCYFAAGYTDMSYSMLRYNTEDINWHMQEFQLFSEQRPYWEALAESNIHSRQSGLRFFLSRDSWAREVSREGGMKELNTLHYKGGNLLLRDAIPMTFYEKEENLILLHPDMARIMSDEEIRYLLGKNVITDAETIAVLTQRGYDLGVKAAELDTTRSFKVRESMKFQPVDSQPGKAQSGNAQSGNSQSGKAHSGNAHPVNPKGFEKWNQTFYTAGKTDVYYLYQPGESVEVISVYEQKNPLEPYAEDERYPYGIATAVVKTSEGAAWGVLGYAPWKGIISLNKRDQILNLADYISGNKLAARVISPVQAVLLPRENSKGETVAVSLINCTIGATGEIELLIRRPASENFRFMSQTQPGGQKQISAQALEQSVMQSQTQCRNQVQCQKLLSFKRAGEDYIVTIPNLEAWTVGTVFCDD